MKRMKKLVSVLIMMALAVTMAIGVSAEEHDINLTNHTFVAYQILSGKESFTTDANGVNFNVLTDVQWGSGINYEAFLGTLKENTETANLFSMVTNAEGFVEALNDIESDSIIARAIAKAAYSNKTIFKRSLDEMKSEGGYYLIVDETVAEDAEVLNASILTLGREFDLDSIKVKTDKPTVEKKVAENTKYDKNEDYGTTYNDVADYNIGDPISFKLIGSVPDMTYYSTYKTYTFHDTLGEGLTFIDDSVKVYLVESKDNNEELNQNNELNGYFKFSYSDNKLTVNLAEGQDLKQIVGDKKGYIVVTYEAVLNENAAIGLPGNKNKVKLEYSNNPDHTGEGDDTHETPEDEVIVFTYDLDVTKVDGKNNEVKLSGASFVLLNEDKTQYAAFKLDNAGNLITREVSEGKQSVVFDKWVKLPDDFNGDWTILAYESYANIVSDEDGFFGIAGLDHGTYHLGETKAPEGYNILKDAVKFEIIASTENGQNWTSDKLGLTELEINVETDVASPKGFGNTETGVVEIEIRNNSGSLLPETGGMGTRILYILGSVLVLGAGILLITRRRMAAK